jgi:hypothetical protein
LAYPQTGWDPVRGITDDEARAFTRDGGGPKVELVVAELMAAVGGHASASAPIGGVLLPARRAEIDRPRLHPVSPDAAAARLASQLFTPDDDAYPDWLERRRRPVETVRAESLALVRAIAASLPVYELEFASGRDGVRAFVDAVDVTA